MKKTSILAALALIMVACTKAPEEPQMRSVTFTFGNILNGSMTKGSDDVLEASAPAGPFILRLTSTTNPNRTYRVNAGEPATIAMDSYRVLCDYYPAGAIEVYRGKLYTEPCFTVNTTITVTEEGVVSLPASYDCWALIIDKTKASSYAVNTYDSPLTVSNWIMAGDYGVVYFRPSGWNDTNSTAITVTPVDDINYGPTTYRVSTGSVAGTTKVESGHWYVFNPDAVETSCGELGISFPSWEQGNE